MPLTVPSLFVPLENTDPLIPGPGPSPLALATHRRVPPPGPGTALIAAGYQPVGMYVGGADADALPKGSPVAPSSTWTAFSPASPTKSIRPSGDSASASGWVPTAAPFTPTGTAVTEDVEVSTTLTSSSLVSATNSFEALSLNSRADGWCPTTT